MSTTPNDPFDNPNAANPNQGQVNYGQGDFAQPPPRKSGNGLLIGCGIAGLLGLLLCCGGFSMISYFGMGAIADVFQAEIAGSPTVVEHIGEIESMSMNLTATGNEAQNAQPGQGGSAIVFDIEGTKGSGQVAIVQSPDGQGVVSAVLIKPDGTRIPIELTGGSGFDDLNMDDLEIEAGDLIESGTTTQ